MSVSMITKRTLDWSLRALFQLVIVQVASLEQRCAEFTFDLCKSTAFKLFLMWWIQVEVTV